MSEEEKKAIKYVKAQKGIYYKIVIEIIEKQQKEIEELKEKAISREKRLEYLRNYGKEHWKEYYKNNKEHILKQAREHREKVKGSPLQSYNYIGLKNMTKEERNEYYRIKMRECRERKKNGKNLHSMWQREQ